MIKGYPDNASIYPGETINFHISTDAPKFNIEIYRQGVNLDLVTSTSTFVGFFANDHDFDQDWGVTAVQRNGIEAEGWPAFPFDIPDNFASGVYIAMFIEMDDNGNATALSVLNNGTSYTPTAKALFVVKSSNPGYNSQVLYKVPYFTYQAYNYVGGSSVYQGTQVTLHRPGGGTGGVPWDSIAGDFSLFNVPYGNWDPFDNYLLDEVRGSPRQTFEHWDAKFISFLEGQGYRIDYCTDMDIHLDNDLVLLQNYSLMLSVGHDEYYSSAMRNSLEAFVAKGGNIAFFSGNTCYWDLFFPEGDLLSINRDFEWGNPQNNQYGWPVRPEDSLIGVSFWNGGERNASGGSGDNNDHNFKHTGYTVQRTNLWPFEDTGVKENDSFGEDQCIIGYECDGSPFDSGGNKPFQPYFNPVNATPPGFVILGFADTSDFDSHNGNHYATMGMYTQNGTVFTGATTDWPRVAWQGEPICGQITKNVLDRLGGDPKGLSYLSNFQNIICCDGFFSDDDGFRHAIVATADGNVSEIFYNPNEGQGQSSLTVQNGVIDLGAFYTSDDQQRHVLTLTDDYNISEIFYNPATGLGIAALGNIPNAQRICGFYSSDDNNRHAIVSTADGNILEIFYGVQGQGQSQIGAFDNIVDIGCFFSDDDNYRHVIVGTGDGNITEIYYSPEFGISQTLIGNIPGLAKISAYYAAGDSFFNRRVQVLDSNSRLYEFRYSPQAGIIKSLLICTSDCFDIGGFFTADDNDRHCIMSMTSGVVQELYFNR